MLVTHTGIYAQSDEAHAGALEEIIVTARKREESLQDTPVAVSAFTTEELEFRQINTTDRLGEITPNLKFDPVAPSSGSSSVAQIFIRGIGQTDFVPVIDPGVGLYIDGIYMGRSVGNIMDFLDIERVEVLRGPQGTLFGRNTIGGAVVIHSKRPTDDFHGSLEGQYGSDNMAYVTAKVNGPITDNLAGNLAYAYRYRDGYVKRIFDGTRTGDDNRHAVRGSLLWNPSDTFEAYATFDYSRTRENGAPAVSGGVNDLQAFATFANGLLASCTVVTINPAFPAGGPPSFPPPGVGTDGAPGCVNENSFLGKHTDGGTFPIKADLDAWGASLEMSWDVNEWLSMKSITGYREFDFESRRDADHTPGNLLATWDTFEHQQVSQELQFSGRQLQDRLKWLLGLYYFQEEGFNLSPVVTAVGAFRVEGDYDNDSLAAFFQGTYDVTDRLAFTFGVRYTEDTKRFTPDQIVYGDASQAPLTIFGPTWPLLTGFYIGPAGPLPAGTRLLLFQQFKKKFDDTSVMANVAYDWTDNLMTYFTYSQGFKSGGFDMRFLTPPEGGVPSSFDPETVDSYEIGIKSQWLDNHLRLNTAIFYTDYQDLQIVIRDPGGNPLTFNGGTADISGGEAELTWVPTERWHITAAVGYLDAKYDELSVEVLPFIQPDSKLVNAPKWNTSLGIAYTYDLQDWATLTPRLDWSFQDKQAKQAVNSPEMTQDAYHLLNASMALQTNDGHWEGVLALRNLLDEKYLITGTSSAATAIGYIEQIYARGFEWSISIKYNFFNYSN
jgi:iron complex outermembrane receptor protein